MDNSKTGGDLAKVTQHLVLLREEYKKLQRAHHELERKYDLLSASSDGDVANTFAAKLLQTVANLYDQTIYSDVTVKLKTREIPAHRFVLAARNEDWSLQSLADGAVLDWSDLGKDVGEAIVRWVYTDTVDLSGGDTHVLQLMKASGQFSLQELVNKCEKILMTSVNVRNCVKFYTTADEIGANTLKEHCSNLISTHWDDFTSEDFEHMSAPLLYRMLNTKTDFPLHSAIRLQREDVVFLYLVEHDSQLSQLLNVVDGRGDLPLDMALRTRQESVAVTLVEHSANLNARDARGRTLLHAAIERGDAYSTNFLLEHGASVSLLTPDRGESALHLVAACGPHLNSMPTSSPFLENSSKSLDLSDDDASSLTLHVDSLPEMAAVASNLLKRGLDPNIRNKDGYTALHVAVMARNTLVVSLLLERTSDQHVDLDAKTDDGHTALYYALIGTTDYHPESFAALLVEAGAQANPPYPKGKGTLLHLLANDGLEEAAMFVAQHAPDHLVSVNDRGETPMHVACARGLPRLIQTLLDNGASPNLQTFAGDDEGAAFRRTPLHVAVAAKQTACAAVIIEYKMNYVCQKGKSRPTPTPDLDAKDSNIDTPLSLALRVGATEIAKHLLRAGANVNERNGKGLTMLHQAITVGDVKTAISLLDHGADINALTSDNETPLQLCIVHGLADVVEALCTRGVDMSLPDKTNQWPLWTALTCDQQDIASILVRNGADTDCWGPGPDDCWQTLLHRAIDENNPEIANFLIRSGCDLNAPRRPGPGGSGGEEAKDRQSPLHLCCSWGLTSTVQTLIEYGGNVNAKDVEENTPLHIAIQNQHAEIISLLLGHPNIDLSLRNRAGLSPFATALTVRNHKAAQAILDKLPTAAEQTDNKGRNFLHVAIQKGDAESVLFLLSIHVDVNSRVNDAKQTPPLHLAAATGDETLVRSLMLAGARPNDVDTSKRTALHVAAHAGHAHIVSALVQKGAAYDAVDSDGESALHVACREGHVAVVRVLLTESDVNAEAVNLKGQNPLHVLARNGKENAAAICELFVECMEDYPINKPDLDGNTALMLAYMRGNGNLCRSLVKAKACIGTMNKSGVTIFNYQVATKQLLYSLLNQLSEVPPWAESDTCLECGTKFALTVRKHHCRHCGRVLCSKCSSQDVPILKFNEKKPVRVCGVCFDFLQNGVA